MKKKEKFIKVKRINTKEFEKTWIKPIPYQSIVFIKENAKDEKK